MEVVRKRGRVSTGYDRPKSICEIELRVDRRVENPEIGRCMRQLTISCNGNCSGSFAIAIVPQ